MRILIYSNSPHERTAYGAFAREMSCRLKQDGHTVAVACTSGIRGQALDWHGVTLYPLSEDPIGRDVIKEWTHHFRADLVLSFCDLWALSDKGGFDFAKQLPCPWAAVVPIDGDPLPHHMVRVAKTADFVISISEFGHNQLNFHGIQNTLIPLAIDCDIFRPGDMELARQELGLPVDAFVVAAVGANKGFPCRKSWPELLTAFARFQRVHADAFLYLHTTHKPLGAAGSGLDFGPLINMLQIPRSAFKFAPFVDQMTSFTDAQMATVYQAADVFALPSMGEGFGKPIIEAQACDCPVIVQDFSAMSELVFNGEAIEPLQPFWLPQLGYYWRLASVDRIFDALQVMKKHLTVDQYTAETIRNLYDWRVIWPQWKNFLGEVEARKW